MLFVGPVGAGKSILAAMAYGAMRLQGPLVTLSSGSVPETLYTDFLFGHLPGAFTDASKIRAGALAEAANGALFLDDLAQMPLLAQSGLLGVMDRGVFRMNGGMREERATCRLLFASTDEPAALVRERRMLPDFASRLGPFVIRVPGLAERTEDILPLAQHAADAFLLEHGIESRVRLDEETSRLLLAYEWPGNVRELKNVVEGAVALALVEDGITHVRSVHLPEALRAPVAKRSNRARLEAELVRRTLHSVGGNKSKAARVLGVHRNTIGRYTPPEE